MPFFDRSEDSSENDINECPSPPETPLAPPPMPPMPEIPPDLQDLYFIPPFQPFERYLRDTRPRQHRTTIHSIRCLEDIISDNMTSADWNDRMHRVREFRRSENQDCFSHLHNQRVTAITIKTVFSTYLLFCTQLRNTPSLLR